MERLLDLLTIGRGLYGHLQWGFRAGPVHHASAPSRTSRMVLLYLALHADRAPSHPRMCHQNSPPQNASRLIRDSKVGEENVASLISPRISTQAHQTRLKSVWGAAWDLGSIFAVGSDCTLYSQKAGLNVPESSSVGAKTGPQQNLCYHWVCRTTFCYHINSHAIRCKLPEVGEYMDPSRMCGLRLRRR